MNPVINNLYRKGTGAIACCLFLIIASCIQQPVFTPETSAASGQSALDYYHWLKTLPETEIAQEREYLEQQPEELDTLVRMTRLALVLSLKTGSGPDDEKNALDLLAQAIDQPGSSPIQRDYQQFGLVWQDVLRQRRQLRQAASKANREVQDERKQMQILREENSALIKQIEALKSIEQQINKREQTRDKAP